MKALLAEYPVNYVGGDIAAEVIAHAKAVHPEVDVRVFDITTDAFREADLWHCRDCLFHLPFEAIQRALENFTSSPIKFAHITSHRSRLLHRNLDEGFGGLRFLDLERAPFFLPPPLSRIPDYRWGYDLPRYVCLWSRDQIADALARPAAL